MTGVRTGSRADPLVYHLPLYYALNPWASTPHGFLAQAYNVTVYGTLKAKDRSEIELDLIQVSPVNGNGMPEPTDKTVRMHMLSAIIAMLGEQTGKLVRSCTWSIVDFE